MPRSIASESVIEREKGTFVDVHRVNSNSSPQPDIADSEVVFPDESRAVNTLLVVACLTFGASSFLFGYDDKVISPLVSLELFVSSRSPPLHNTESLDLLMSSQVKKYQGLNHVTQTYVFTAHNQQLLFSIPLIGSIIGALLATPLNFYLGRKLPLILAYFFSLGGVFLQLFAPSLTAFVLGRFWNNVTMGVASATAPLYLADVVPARMRGRSVTSMNFLNVFSGVVATLVVFGTHSMKSANSYRIPILIQSVIPALLIPLTVYLPESPQWLISKNRMEPALASLRKLRGYQEEATLIEELRLMKACEDNVRQLKRTTHFFHLFNKENIRRTVISGSFFSLNQVSGIILSTTYATVFLTDLGVGNPYTLTVVSSACVLAGTIAALFIIDRLGRRPTALSGMSMLLIIDVIAGGLAFLPTKGHLGRTRAISIAALSFLFNFFWSTSFYSLSSVLPAELSTPKLRAHTMSYTIAWAQTTAVITTFAVPQLVAADGANLGAKTYLVFGGCMLCILVFVALCVPETSGRTSKEIDELFDQRVKAWRWKGHTTTAETEMGRGRDRGDLPLRSAEMTEI
jgi:sugar porter (SP) family MFS transporter